MMIAGLTFTQELIFERIVAERLRQDAKFGEPDIHNSALLWLAVLTEEVGEVAREVTATRPGDSHHTGANAEALRRELTQAVAVGVAWLEALERKAGQ
jgi:NTP pyrophosphatase (non-canonical NTP hydrolase)